jgi:cytochrome c biogenesis protein CcdA
MYCPNCSQKNYDQQKFCRKCGMNLERISAALTEQLPERDADIERSEARLEVFGNIALIGFGIVILAGAIGILYTIITKMILSGTQPLVGVLLANFIIFAMLMLAYVVFREDLNERKKRARTVPVPVAEPEIEVDTNKLLQDPIHEPVPSIVEDTTDLLPVKKKTREL